MTKSISCKDAGKDCSWSAESTRNDDEELISMIKEHVLAEHKEIELNSESDISISCLSDGYFFSSTSFLKLLNASTDFIFIFL